MQTFSKKLAVSKGFTLTEMAFSIAIMSIISIAMSTLLTSAYQAQYTHRTSALVEGVSMNFTEQLRRDARLAAAVQINGVLSNNLPANAQPFGAAGNTMRLYYLQDNNGNIRQDLWVEYSIDNNLGRLRRRANYNPERRTFFPNEMNIVFVGQQMNGQNDINGFVGRCLNLAPNNNNSGNNNNLANNCFRFDTTILYAGANPQQPGQILQSALTRVTVNGLQIGPPPENQANNNMPNPQVFAVDTFGRPVFNIRQVSFELGGAKIFR